MKLRAAAAILLVLAASAVCVRLGLWQLGRLHEKRAANAALRAALAAPPAELDATAALAPPPAGRPVALAGAFDPARQILVRGRLREGDPGVEVVTPWLLPGDSVAVLVSRGWLAAEDGATLPAAAIPPDTSRRVTGLAEPYAARGLPGALRALAGPPAALWSTARLDRDSIAARLPYRLAGWWLRALPDPAAPPAPRRDPPAPAAESMHLGYAIQWFAIATLFPIAAWLVARRGRAAAPRA